jgi:hypothetical protein
MPPPASIKKGDLFPVGSKEDWQGRFSTSEDARGARNLAIDIVAVQTKSLVFGPGFEPSLITGSPGQVPHLTVQANDASANFQHNFSIDQLHIDKDIPQGPGNSISVTVTRSDGSDVTKVADAPNFGDNADRGPHALSI